MMRGILDMSDQTVREVMSPRMDIRAVSTEASVGDVLKVATEFGVSRIPLYEESIDHIIGVVYAKDLLAYFLTGDIQPSLVDIARPPYFVPETKRAAELLADLRRDQVHLAIAVDEYGGTAGVVTVEDLLEEIVGEITDEHDFGEVDVQRVSDDEVIVDARFALDDLSDLFGIEIEGEDFDTVGGLVFALLGRLAVPGDQVVDGEHGLRLRVISILGRRIKEVSVARLSDVPEPASAD
jgi:CBS domain containing-hemolysin-like protein